MATENTGYKAYRKLAKVTNDGTNRALDINDQLCEETGLPQHIKDNIISDPNYIPPVYDIISCPITPISYLLNISEEYISGTDVLLGCDLIVHNATGYTANQIITPGTVIYRDAALTTRYFANQVEPYLLYGIFDSRGVRGAVKITEDGIVDDVRNC